MKRLRLYSDVRLEVLKRDSWKCQLCGSMQNLNVHHQTFKSHGGSNAINNLIAVCSSCHFKIHYDEGTRGSDSSSNE
jgi:5-methylcytosine-specific restriction endonuclease McrA